MYPNMQIRIVMVGDKEIKTDSEGYIVHLDDWTEAFAYAQAEVEGLVLTGEHWEVINFLRNYFHKYGVQCEVRKMVKYFKQSWGKEKGSSTYLHRIFPRGGPQKQGNRLAGLLRTKGEH